MNSRHQQKNRIERLQEVIKILRSEDLKQGHCFMIFDDELPENQAYYEYPDGSIRIEQLNQHSLDMPRLLIKVLTPLETAAVKRKHEVFH